MKDDHVPWDDAAARRMKWALWAMGKRNLDCFPEEERVYVDAAMAREEGSEGGFPWVLCHLNSKGEAISIMSAKSLHEVEEHYFDGLGENGFLILLDPKCVCVYDRMGRPVHSHRDEDAGSLLPDAHDESFLRIMFDKGTDRTN